jgi:3-oxoacyl-[acyl-carrier protein] reductase
MSGEIRGTGSVLVTGSSRGIGRAIALDLASNGWQVWVHGSRASGDLEEVAKELGPRCAGVIACDLIQEDAEQVLEGPLSAGLDALVNNAGIYRQVPFAESSDEVYLASYRLQFRLNFEVPCQLMRAFIAHQIEVGQPGKILNVASRVGFRGEAGAAMYSASKAALINVTRALAVEYASKGIGLFGIAPGWVETAMSRDGMDDRLATILEGIPLGRMASPEDCAAAASFLLSDKASYLSGVTIDINGASYFH